MAKEFNPRLKLTLPVDLVNWVELELQFLGVGDRVVMIEENGVRRKSDFLRLAINSAIVRWLDAGVATELETPENDEGNRYLDFYLDSTSKGLWDSAIKAGYATSYAHVANKALTEYWDRQYEIGQSVGNKLQLLCDVLARSGGRLDMNEIRAVLNV